MVAIAPSSSPCPERMDVSISIAEGANQDTGRKEKLTDDSISQQRGQWLRAAVLGANDGLVSTASLMMGVGAVKSDAKSMVVSGLAALVGGACSMAIGEFVSVYAQRDVEVSNKKVRANKLADSLKRSTELELVQQGSTNNPTTITTPSPAPSPISKDDNDDESLPNPFQAALASAMAFCVGGVVPLLSAAFIADSVVRIGVMGGVSSVALVLFGALGAYYGRSPMVKGTLRVLVGGWIAMLITYGFLKVVGKTV